MPVDKPLRVAVLGAGGTIAPAIVHDLGVSDEVERMLLLDLDPERAAAVASAHGAEKATSRAVDAHDVDALAGGRDPVAARDGQLRPPYAVQTLLDELTLSPIVLRDGRAIEIEPLSSGGVVDFGDPIGRADTIYTLHSELATFGESFGASSSSFRLSLAPPVLARLRDLIGASADEIAAAAREAVRPSSETVSIHMVKAVAHGGEKIIMRAVTRPF